MGLVFFQIFLKNLSGDHNQPGTVLLDFASEGVHQGLQRLIGLVEPERSCHLLLPEFTVEHQDGALVMSAKFIDDVLESIILRQQEAVTPCCHLTGGNQISRKTLAGAIEAHALSSV